MKKFVSFLCAGLMLLLGAGCGDNDNSVKSSVDVVLYTEGMEYTETEKGEPLTYYALYYDFLGGETVMPVGGFYAPYSAGGSLDGNNINDFLTDEVFSALADAGINNMFYFRQCFKEEFGVNPSEYLKELKGNHSEEKEK